MVKWQASEHEQSILSLALQRTTFIVYSVIYVNQELSLNERKYH